MGVALLEPRTRASTELYLIAVEPDQHARGVGAQLVSAVESDLRGEGKQLLEVHTVGPSHADVHYARTRGFYLARDFLPLHEFEGIDWDGPTLVLVKPL